ncbi:MAG: carbon storage regulator CsrA [Candidatus Brocadiia bacterium]
MLVLSRKINETIVVGDQIRITIVELHKDNVKLGIEAPRHIAVLREEIRKRPDFASIAAEAPSPAKPE